jgi:tetratricopeptide (TPR) repeat protein
MGKKLITREEDPVLHDLGRWMDFLGVSYVDLAKEWKVSRSAAYKRLSGRQSLGVNDLGKALAILDLAFDDFLHGVRTGYHPELLLADVAAEDRDQVKNFRRNHLRQPPRRAYGSEELRQMAEGLETLRFRDPRAAWDDAREVLRTADLEPDVAAEAWGVMGVLNRFKGRPAITAFCLGETFRAGGSASTKARNFTRLAMLLFCHVGDAGLALEATRDARELYCACGDTAGEGKTMVDEAVVLVNGTGDYRRALAAYEKALKLLPEELVVYRFCALQGIAVACVYLGDVRRALERLDQALAVAVEHPAAYLSSGVLWLKGEIVLLLGHHREAARYFGIVRDRYLDLQIGPVEIAVISLRLAKAHFLLGDRRQVRRTLEDVLFRLGDVERANPLLGAALGEFLRETARGQVTAELLEEIYRTLRGGAETAPPLLPVELPTAAVS